MSDNDDVIFLDIETFLEGLAAAIPDSGGAFTVEALLRRMEAADLPLDLLAPPAKLALVRRLLELSAHYQAQGGPMFLEINRRTGRIFRPKCPRGVEPVGAGVIFAPR